LTLFLQSVVVVFTGLTFFAQSFVQRKNWRVNFDIKTAS